MAFTATLYNVTDDPKKVEKTLGTAKATCTCTPYEPVSDLHGLIVLDYTAAIESSNYASVTSGIGGRTLYCYITDLVKGIGGKCTVQLEIDPLMTNKEQLKNCDCICATTVNTTQYSTYIPDGNYKSYQYTIVSNDFGGYNQEDLNHTLDFEDVYVIVGTIG